ncbi:adenine nucleotide alpha hydrolase family protein [Prescottella equi]|uniref:hypothetical protein n=1 Tax=Rhodococcus hoagii TaxID=43767 RepID=UPI000D0FAA84|nr:hypothetical protein [Prescottella equi]AVP67337.1 hypothetical protein C7H75_04855 [Prescottella equi]AVP67396.1 hypothetical protein C7H75_05175 [Prescottella equi]
MSEPAIRVLSLGAGVQSTVLALMACDGTLPGLNAAIFADTGWEPPAVYEQVDRLQAEFDRAGIPLHRVTSGNLRSDFLDPDRRFVSVPYFTRNADGSDGMGRRQCTSEYKLKPIKKQVRELLGYPHPIRVPRGVYAEQWIGFSTDEVHRVRDRLDVQYERPRYPLLELGMDRKACERWLKASGWGHTAKSACIGCPFHGNQQWRIMRDQHPEQWADACDFDERIRKGGASAKPLDGEAFLHRSRVPLSIAPIGRVTSREWADAQMTIDDEISEYGDPDGCSPYGCRSGEAAEATAP